MTGVVIPAPYKVASIRSCLRVAALTAAHPVLDGERVEVITVQDGRADATCMWAASARATTLTVRARDLGVARPMIVEASVARGPCCAPFTNVDTVVLLDGMVPRLILGADALCGTVGVDDWPTHGKRNYALKSNFERTYCVRAHYRRVHGANSGISAHADRRAGRFKEVARGQDLGPVQAPEAAGREIAWSASECATPSARVDLRAPMAFAGAIFSAAGACSRPARQSQSTCAVELEVDVRVDDRLPRAPAICVTAAESAALFA